MTWSPPAEAFEAERHGIPTDEWEKHLDNFPKEWADQLRAHQADPMGPGSMGGPTGIALVPDKGYCIIACGQGPFIVWAEWEDPETVESG